MKKLVCVCLMAGALIAAMQNPAAIEGKWEGEVNGLKAITLTVHVTKGQMEGSVIFYVTRDDDGQGKRVVGQDERKMLETHWDGKTLRFAVGAPDFEPDTPGVRFTMTVTGDKKAELKILGEHEQTLALARVE
jgi:hypothetical protein